MQPGDVRSSLRRAPAGEGAEAHDLQPSEVLGAYVRYGSRRPTRRPAPHFTGAFFTGAFATRRAG